MYYGQRTPDRLLSGKRIARNYRALDRSDNTLTGSITPLSITGMRRH